jgi:hypothetical protein
VILVKLFLVCVGAAAIIAPMIGGCAAVTCAVSHAVYFTSACGFVELLVPLWVVS